MGLGRLSNLNVLYGFRYEKQDPVAFTVDGNHRQDLGTIERLARHRNQRLDRKGLLPNRVPPRLRVTALLNFSCHCLAKPFFSSWTIRSEFRPKDTRSRPVRGLAWYRIKRGTNHVSHQPFPQLPIIDL